MSLALYDASLDMQSSETDHSGSFENLYVVWVFSCPIRHAAL